MALKSPAKLGKPASTPPPSSPPFDSSKGFCGKRPLVAIVYGPPGVGKTSLGANFPDVGFMIGPGEQGIHELIDFNQCPTPKKIWEPTTHEETLDMLDKIACKNEHKIKTLVMDSAAEFERMCFHFHCDQNYDGNWTKEGFLSFQQGPKGAAKTDWPKLLDALSLLTQNGINVIMLAHSEVKPFSNPEGKDYDRYTASLDKQTWQQLHRWAGCILFINFYCPIEQENRKAKAKASGDIKTMMFTSPHPAYDAKNRYGLPETINLGDSGASAFAAFKSAYVKAGSK